MEGQKQKQSSSSVRYILTVSILSLVLLASPADLLAVPVSPGGAFSVTQSPIYRVDPPIPYPVWEVPSTLNSGSVKNTSVPGGNKWQFLGTDAVSFTWTGNPLDQDLSSGGLAHATFLAGGTLSIYGKLRRIGGIPPFVEFDSYDPLKGGNATNPVPVLTATLGAFELRETDVNSNTLNSINNTIEFTPTGGFLYTNSILQLNGTYAAAIVGAVAGPMAGGPLNDFSTDLKSLNAFLINYNIVPEATSILLLGCGMFVMGLRRRFHSSVCGTHMENLRK